MDFVAGFTFGSVRCELLLSGDGEKNGGGYWKNSKAGFFFFFFFFYWGSRKKWGGGGAKILRREFFDFRVKIGGKTGRRKKVAVFIVASAAVRIGGGCGRLSIDYLLIIN